ncbi:hypothetical protein ACPPVU_02495 [Mucilaginibacter sp. McL0603]|uniref:hypothetical protein n=1 Tax=Mucilaginibacter sp. McL0603 TaxID=3415670 RepID=UPI003CF9EE3A
MFIYEWDLTPDDLWLNADYTNSSTLCRFRKNDMIVAIERKVTGDFITLDYEVVFESVQTCNKVASASFTTTAEFKTTKDRKEDIISMNNFLSEVFLKIEDTLMYHSNIPISMIKTPMGITSSYDRNVLVDTVFEELTTQGFYS